MVKKFNYLNLNSVNVNFDFCGKNVVIYGRGVASLRTIVEMVQMNAHIIGVTDSFAKNGEEFAGYPVLEVGQLAELGEAVLYIAVNNLDYKREILYKIESLNLSNLTVVCHGSVYGAGKYNVDEMKKMEMDSSNKIKFIKSMLSDEKSKKTFQNMLEYRITNNRMLIEEVFDNSHKQYFPNDGMLKCDQEEVFIDCGGYDGASTITFAEWAGKTYKKSYILEPDKTMFHICEEMLKINKIENAEVVNKATYSKCMVLSFDSSNFSSGSGMINDYGKNKVEGISVDELLKGDKATFIKMDIEGAEMEALSGAEKTISKFRPKLAISIYHKPDDLWEIPYYLMNKYPFYKFYMRHYTPITTETVLYAAE